MSSDRKVSYAINEAFRLEDVKEGLRKVSWRFVEGSKISRIIGLVDTSSTAVGARLLDDLFGTNFVIKTSIDCRYVFGAITRDRELLLYVQERFYRGFPIPRMSQSNSSGPIRTRLLTTLADDIIRVTVPNSSTSFDGAFDYENLNLYKSLPPKRIIEVSVIEENAESTVFEDLALSELTKLSDLKKARQSLSKGGEIGPTRLTVIPSSRRWAEIRKHRLCELSSL